MRLKGIKDYERDSALPGDRSPWAAPAGAENRYRMRRRSLSFVQHRLDLGAGLSCNHLNFRHG